MSLADQLQAYLARTTGKPVTVKDLTRIPGGASRETYRFDADIGGEHKGLILRRDPIGSLIDTDRRLEFLAYRSFHGRGVPVPEPVALEADGAELERPFFIMGRVDGGNAASPFTVIPYGEHAQTLGEQFFSILGAIHSVDPAEARARRVLATRAGLLGRRHRRRRTAPAAHCPRRHPSPAPRAAGPRTGDPRRPRRLPERQLPARRSR